MRIFHIATAADWAAVKRTGSYEVSTLGRTLAEEGFIHASRREQVASTFARFYAEVHEPLVLLTIETDRLTAPWREDEVDGATFPHIYGPLNRAAVVGVQPLNADGGTEPLTILFVREMVLRIVLAVVGMLLVAAGVTAGKSLHAGWGALAGAGVGVAAAALLFAVVLRRRG
ncbi:MAG: DUF952 domain-containing protein [Nocardioidaceae bacterium]|nr:DUF952 domain-containing protein [Nocardioidaceae bacterium]